MSPLRWSRLTLAVGLIAFDGGLAQPAAPAREPSSSTRTSEAVAEPYLFAYGSVPVLAGAVLEPGGTLRVYGRGFCGRAPCPPVVLRLGPQTPSREVPVTEDGTFSVSLSPAEPSGQYFVVARQDLDGQPLEAAAPFSILPREVGEAQPAAK